ncbi:hypothetical protein DYL59_09220 [Pseudomonas kairouanensis]|uniref:DUF3077 domain-containing protein n=1 Tax=Pseudomonas kairouanensis TaxID=2293832 RepID=A0A4Z0AVZ0_9PSED|nr:hypothetical protein [Pseudomonas kairouanensis]TFY90284.1 hypothetical protein DYL59_09220 [Pseudomonas kairouanensis]
MPKVARWWNSTRRIKTWQWPASHVLRSAAATAYESASSHQGNQRDLAFSVEYLIDMANAKVERSLQAPQAQANA